MDEKEDRYTSIRENYYHVEERISNAARKSGRSRDDVRLVVVTKTQPIEVVHAVIDAGAHDIGENYVEEAVPKIQNLETIPGINWHMIGHVQSRKAQNVCTYFQYLHSLDSVKLAGRLSRFSIEQGKTFPVWLEFNTGGEDSKSGWDISAESNWSVLLPEIQQIISLPGLELLGAMTVPPYSNDPAASRPYFQKLRKFQEYIINHFQLTGFGELSMGMSADFEVAIMEGSACVRIGQAILGPRKV